MLLSVTILPLNRCLSLLQTLSVTLSPRPCPFLEEPRGEKGAKKKGFQEGEDTGASGNEKSQGGGEGKAGEERCFPDTGD